MIKPTTSLRKISSLKKKIWVIQGGQGAGKTISVLMLLINHASSHPNKEILILSGELTKMRLTVIKDFVKVMRSFGIYEDKNFVSGTLYRFPNGSFIKFIGLDKDDVGKGLRSDVCYFNEVNKVTFESYNEIASRSNKVICDFNPNAEFFIHTEVIIREDCDFIKLTFEDNEHLGEQERQEILNYKIRGYDEDGSIINEYWANKWQVYGLGNVGSLLGAIFTNWNLIDLPTEAKLLGFGLDFGFTNDPTTLVGVYNYNNSFVFKEFLYSSGLTNNEIAERIKDITQGYLVYADSSEPKSIEEIRRNGINIVGAVKGVDSVMFGIDKLQQDKFYVTKESVNLINELRSYTWMQDKNGKAINKPIDKHNHLIDAIRYFVVSKDKYNGKY